jgi:hypothetical protein
MPNHIHGDLFIIERTVRAKHSVKNNVTDLQNINKNALPLRQRPHGTLPGSLSAIMQNFLSVSPRKIREYIVYNLLKKE